MHHWLGPLLQSPGCQQCSWWVIAQYKNRKLPETIIHKMNQSLLLLPLHRPVPVLDHNLNLIDEQSQARVILPRGGIGQEMLGLGSDERDGRCKLQSAITGIGAAVKRWGWVRHSYGLSGQPIGMINRNVSATRIAPHSFFAAGCISLPHLQDLLSKSLHCNLDPLVLVARGMSAAASGRRRCST